MSYQDELLTRRTDWDRTRWCGFLPSEGFGLWDVLCEATENDVEGELDDVVAWVRDYGDPWSFGLRLLGDLDAPIDYNRFRSDQRRLVRLFGKAGHEYPTTARALAWLGVELGLYLREVDEGVVRWRVPRALPLPTEILPMSARQRQREDDFRLHQLWSLPASHIVDTLRDMGCPTDVATDVREISGWIGEHPDTVRNSLAFLTDTRFESHWGRPLLRVLTVSSGQWRPADPERLEAWEHCVLVPNWRGLYARYGLAWALECEAGEICDSE
ncbi:DUF6042 family protein [Stackebrandtia soli]|uniref:DUF6042 family protein n=1 Tax=Stackebrandtia soli TaxID=1892856 RepID=UPI0039E89E98